MMSKPKDPHWLGALRDHVGAAQISPRLKSAPIVAVLAGPAICIEVIVRQASEASGIPMDWGYVGGRAMVHADGDREKARYALFHAFPLSDLRKVDQVLSD